MSWLLIGIVSGFIVGVGVGGVGVWLLARAATHQAIGRGLGW